MGTWHRVPGEQAAEVGEYCVFSSFREIARRGSGDLPSSNMASRVFKSSSPFGERALEGQMGEDIGPARFEGSRGRGSVVGEMLAE